MHEVELMASLSKIFKASNLSIIDEVKIISQPYIPNNRHVSENPSPFELEAEEDNQNLKVIEEAQHRAKEIIEFAEQKAHSIEEATVKKIEQWWEDNEKKLEDLSIEAKHLGYQDGFSSGELEARQQVEQEYQDKLAQVEHLLEQAYEQKEEIVSEAEPFLLELSTVIAEQIIKQELSEHPGKFVELIKQHILRFKEKEYITVCVHPDDFDFIQSQRSLLIAVVNGETEFKIIPDHSVSPKGCIIRTAYGSVDARIDTQIEEIKKVILEARREPKRDNIS